MKRRPQFLIPLLLSGLAAVTVQHPGRRPGPGGQRRDHHRDRHIREHAASHWRRQSGCQRVRCVDARRRPHRSRDVRRCGHRVASTDHRPRSTHRSDQRDRDRRQHRSLRRRGLRQPTVHADRRTQGARAACRTARTMAARPLWTRPSPRYRVCTSRPSA